MEKKIKQFKEWIEQSNNIVFFGGAGVSTESGIPDFRSADGLYHQKYAFPPETILSHTFYTRMPLEFYKFYRDKMIHDEAKPSTTHLALAKLEQEGKLRAVVTQNIDGLHQMAGSKNVIEIHGTIHKNHCVRCGKEFGLEAVRDSEGIPRCECGGMIKPDVVLYEENLNDEDVRRAVEYISDAQVLIVGGTSLGVFPAAGLIDYYKGDKLILVNKSVTQYDKRANLLIHEALGKVFGIL
jgi:NAD-dependent deacetylase